MISPEREHVGVAGNHDRYGEENPDEGLPSDRSGREQQPVAIAGIRGFLQASLSLRRRRLRCVPLVPLYRPRNHPAEENRDRQLEWQVNTYCHGKHRCPEAALPRLEHLVEHDHGDCDQHPHADHPPREPASEHAARNGRHEGGLRRGERIGVGSRGDPDSIRLEQERQHRRHHKGGGDDADELHDLLLVRRRAHDAAGLEVLHVVAGDRRATRHRGSDQDGGGGADKALGAQQCHQQQRRSENGGDRDTRDGVIGRADEAGHVGGDRGEEESGNQHHDGHQHADADVTGERYEQREKGHERSDQGNPDPLHGNVPLPAVGTLAVPPAFPGPAVGFHSGGDATYQALAHRDERPEPSDHHRTHTEVSGLCGPQLVGGGHGVGCTGGNALHDRHDGNRHEPIEGAAQEDQHGDVEPHDVSDADQGRREIRSEIGYRSPDVGCFLENAAP